MEKQRRIILLASAYSNTSAELQSEVFPYKMRTTVNKLYFQHNHHWSMKHLIFVFLFFILTYKYEYMWYKCSFRITAGYYCNSFHQRLLQTHFLPLFCINLLWYVIQWYVIFGTIVLARLIQEIFHVFIPSSLSLPLNRHAGGRNVLFVLQQDITETVSTFSLGVT